MVVCSEGQTDKKKRNERWGWWWGVEGEGGDGEAEEMGGGKCFASGAFQAGFRCFRPAIKKYELLRIRSMMRSLRVVRRMATPNVSWKAKFRI